MHMHAQLGSMRTTIEILDHQRAKLMEMAARRGMKGFSLLVQEAIDRYLAEAATSDETVSRALSVLGTLSDSEANEMKESISELRATWR